MAEAAPASARVGAAFARRPAPELAVIVPTLNERDNIAPLLAKLTAALDGLDWEAVFVDDDSEDGTWAVLQDCERRLPQVRALRRIGRRGLASACIEGMLATRAPYLAVIDADLQHDETILPTMLATLKAGRLDAVVGTRFAPRGSVGDFGRGRLLISRLGRLLSRAVTRAELSDPMSGYFVIDRAFFEETVRRLSAHGFKILLDLFASSPRRVRFAEVPYRFRPRAYGESKLDMPVLLEYVALLGDKLLGRHVASPLRCVRPGRAVRRRHSPGRARAMFPLPRDPVLLFSGRRYPGRDHRQLQSQQCIHLSRPAAARMEIAVRPTVILSDLQHWGDLQSSDRRDAVQTCGCHGRSRACLARSSAWSGTTASVRS